MSSNDFHRHRHRQEQQHREIKQRNQDFVNSIWRSHPVRGTTPNQVGDSGDRTPWWIVIPVLVVIGILIVSFISYLISFYS